MLFRSGVAGTTRPAATGVDQDGWMETRATLSLPAGERPLRVKLHVEFPGWAGVPAGRLQLVADGRAEALHPLPPGETVAGVIMAPSSAPRSLRLELADAFSLPAPDLRRRGARLLKVEVEEMP